MRKQTLTSHSPKQTRDIGVLLAKKLKPGMVVCLHGELGSGKTTLTQGIAQGLGFAGFVRSPSYVIINEYKIKNTALFHIDLYRVKAGGLDSLGLDEYLCGNGICVIEWAEKIDTASLVHKVDIRMKYTSDKEREIKVLYTV